MKKLFVSILVVSSLFLQGCAKEISKATTPSEKMFYMLVEVALYAVGTTIVLHMILSWIDIYLKQRARIVMLVILTVIFSYLEFGTSGIGLPF